MHVLKLLSIGATLCLSISAQNAQIKTVVEDVISLDSDVKTLTIAVEAYQGQLLAQGAPLLIDLGEVLLATQKGADDSDLLPEQLTVSDALLIITTVNQTLTVDNPIAVAALQAKKPLFQSAGLDSFVQASLEQLLREHLEFSDTVLAKTPLSLLDEAVQVVNIITDALENGIAYFAN